MPNITKKTITTHQVTHIGQFFFMLFRILFDIGFFYTLMPIFWSLGVLVFNNNLSSSTLCSFIITMVLYHVIKNDRYKCLLMMGVVVIAIALGTVLYMNNYKELSSTSIMSVVSSILAFLSFVGLRSVQRNRAKQQGENDAL